MRRRRFKILFALSAILLVGTIGLWVWSFDEHEFGFFIPDGYLRLSTADGSFQIRTDTNIQAEMEIGRVPIEWNEWAAFRYWTYTQFNGRKTFILGISYWPIALLASVPLVMPLVRRAAAWNARRKADLIGKCVRCGYDLRATPARCPECGHVPVADDRGTYRLRR